MEIDAGLLPLTLDGPFANVSDGGDLSKRKAAKKFQVDDFCEYGVRLGQFVSSLTDLHQFMLIYRILDFGFERRNLKLAAPFLSRATASMIDNQTSHNASGVAHESLAVGERSSVISGHLDVGLV